MKLAIVNSDQRMQEVYFSLANDYETVLINAYTDFDRIDDADALILPVKGLTSTGSLYASGKEIIIPKSFWQRMQEKKIFAGIPQPFLHDFPHVHYYMQDEEIKRKNAVFTAEGTLFLLIDHTGRSIQDVKVDIIGYGACGREIAKWLDALRIPIRIVRRNTDEKGRFVNVADYRKGSCGDVIINTSPSIVLDRELLTRWHNKPLIIDIATPDVIDYDAALKKDIRVIKAGNLPNMVAYESSGKLIADYVRGKIQDGK